MITVGQNHGLILCEINDKIVVEDSGRYESKAYHVDDRCASVLMLRPQLMVKVRNFAISDQINIKDRTVINRHRLVDSRLNLAYHR